ncbi:DUF2278 family protein [Paenibacillus sp. H1-7]|nr:DUF2278 family protein [Paenibacillus sp. H1-7]
MSIAYGVLKCKAIGRKAGTGAHPHFQIHGIAGGVQYRIAVNVKSQLHPSELLYYTDEWFEHEVTAGLPELPFGFTRLPNRPGGMALDYIRGNLFDRRNLVPLAFDVPGRDNDLNEKLEMYIKRAMDCEDAVLYAYGDPWGPEPKLPDTVFGFVPGSGVHDIHMNQGNSGSYAKDNGVYRDGGLLIHFPADRRWIAIFLAFQSQSWHTDDRTGSPLDWDGQTEHGPSPNAITAPEEAVTIVGAVVLPARRAGFATVTLLNASEQTVLLDGWSLANKLKQKYRLSGGIAPGQFRTLELEGQPDFLKQRGDIITLLDPRGLKVHGVSYTRRQVRPGWTIRF